MRCDGPLHALATDSQPQRTTWRLQLDESAEQLQPVSSAVTQPCNITEELVDLVT